MTSMTSFWCLYCKLWADFTYCSGVSMVDFEKVNASWGYISQLTIKTSINILSWWYFHCSLWTCLTYVTKTISLHIFKSCLPEILLCPFLNTFIAGLEDILIGWDYINLKIKLNWTKNHTSIFSKWYLLSLVDNCILRFPNNLILKQKIWLHTGIYSIKKPKTNLQTMDNIDKITRYFHNFKIETLSYNFWQNFLFVFFSRRFRISC